MDIIGFKCEKLGIMVRGDPAASTPIEVDGVLGRRRGHVGARSPQRCRHRTSRFIQLRPQSLPAVVPADVEERQLDEVRCRAEPSGVDDRCADQPRALSESTPMDALEFISSLVGSLAWPITVIAVAIAFRKGIRAALARPLRRMKAGPFEAEWEEQAAEAAVDVAKSPETGDRPPPPPMSIVSHRFRALAEQSPQAAVLAAYAQVEGALRRRLIIAGHKDIARRPTTARQLAQEGQERGVLSPQIAEAVRGITVMRNLAAFGPADELDVQKALDYLVLADAVI